MHLSKIGPEIVGIVIHGCHRGVFQHEGPFHILWNWESTSFSGVLSFETSQGMPCTLRSMSLRHATSWNMNLLMSYFLTGHFLDLFLSKSKSWYSWYIYITPKNSETANNHTVHGSENPKEPPFWMYTNLVNNSISTTIHIHQLPSINQMVWRYFNTYQAGTHSLVFSSWPCEASTLASCWLPWARGSASGSSQLDVSFDPTEKYARQIGFHFPR